MSDLSRPMEAQTARLRPRFSNSRDEPRVDDRRVLSGIVFVNRKGLRWCDAPKDYGLPQKGGMNTKLRAIGDATNRPLRSFMTAGQGRDYTGAAALLDNLAKTQWLLADRARDAGWFRDALGEKGIKACVAGRT